MAVSTTSSSGRGAQPSAAARATAEWLRQLEYLAHSARNLGPDCPPVTEQVDRLVEGFEELVQSHAPLALRVTPREIWLRDELVVRGPEFRRQEEATELPLPFLLQRDGITGIAIDANASRGDARTLVGAMARVLGAPSDDEDLATLLWAADLDGLRVEVASLDVHPFEHGADDPFRDTPVATPAPAEVDAPGAGAPPDPEPADVLSAWRALQPEAPAALADFRRGWAGEHAQPWCERVEGFVGQLAVLGDGPEVGEALTRALAGWFAAATQVGDWNEAAWAWNALNRVDPERRWSPARIAEALGAIDAETVAERLDSGERDPAARFFTLAVHVGRPALDLVVRVLGRSTRQRVRAAATTALAYICAGDPRPLAPYLRDNRWFVARNVVFVLGQIGGESAGTMLSSALGHPDARVRRAAVTALGQVPLHRRTALLVKHLDAQDPATLAHVLAMISREPDPAALAALLERVIATDFESRPEDERVALIGALGELGGDSVLPELERMLHAGGWFARRTPDRTAVAQAIAAIGTPGALHLLSEGQRARAEAVRSACVDALGAREQSA
jgi:HEAT repeat protein